MPDDGRERLATRRGMSGWLLGALALGLLVGLAILVRDVVTVLELWLLTVVLAALGSVWRKGRRQPGGAQPGTVKPGAAPLTRADPAVPEPEQSASAMPATSHPAVLTVEEVAGLLRVEVAEVVAEIQRGRLPGNQVGEHWRVRAASLDRWLDGHYQGPGVPHS